MKIPMDTFAERAWYAYQCLPRGRGGKPPSIDSLLGRPRRAMLTRLFTGERTDPRQETRKILAEVLKVPREWLDYGKGDPPALTGPYQPLRLDESLRDHDPDEWARKYEAIGGVPTATPNNFQIAVLFFRKVLSPAAITEVANDAHGQWDSQEPIEWARRLHLAQIRATGSGFDLRLPFASADSADESTQQAGEIATHGSAPLNRRTG